MRPLSMLHAVLRLTKHSPPALLPRIYKVLWDCGICTHSYYPTQATACATCIWAFGRYSSDGRATRQGNGKMPRDLENVRRSDSRLQSYCLVTPACPFSGEPYATDRILQLQGDSEGPAESTPSFFRGSSGATLTLIPAPSTSHSLCESRPLQGPHGPGPRSLLEARHPMPCFLASGPSIHPRRLNRANHQHAPPSSVANHHRERHIAEPRCSLMPSLEFLMPDCSQPAGVAGPLAAVRRLVSSTMGEECQKYPGQRTHGPPSPAGSWWVGRTHCRLDCGAGQTSSIVCG